VFQETFLAAFRAWPPPRSGNDRAWLYRIATNKSIDRGRRTRKVVSLEDVRLAAPGRDGVTMLDLVGAIRVLPAGGNIAHLDKKGTPTLVSGRVVDRDGRPIAGAVLDVWQAQTSGLYDSQDTDLDGLHMRGKFRTDSEGRYLFVGIKPVSYSIPDDGPVGQLLQMLGRHPFRPAHIHLLVSAEGFVPVTTHLFVKGDKYLDSDAVFGTKDSLVVEFVRNTSEQEAARYSVTAPFYIAEFTFVLKPR